MICLTIVKDQINLNGDLKFNLKCNKSYIFVGDFYGANQIQQIHLFYGRNQIKYPSEEIPEDIAI